MTTDTITDSQAPGITTSTANRRAGGVLAQTRSLTMAGLRMQLRDTEALLGLAVAPLLFIVAFRLFDLPIEGLPPGTDYFDFVLPGLLAMGLMQLLMVGMAGSIARYREMQILKRMVVTPVRASSFIAGQVTSRLLLAVVKLGLMLGLGIALGASVAGSWTLMITVATAGNLVFLTLAFVVAGRVDTVEGANNLAGLATIPLMFLSGMFFPIETMPEFLQTAVRYLPITPVIDALRAIALEGAGITDIGSELAVISAWIVTGFVLARATFRFGEE